MKCSDEISIGEYVRDIFGRIGQIYQYDHGTYRTKKFGASSGEIVKHSKEIIDLIQKDDYVNGCKVYEVREDEIVVYLDRKPINCYNYIMKDDIKSIVTKEQIKQIEFRIKE